MEFLNDNLNAFKTFISDVKITTDESKKQLIDGQITISADLLVNGVRVDRLPSKLLLLKSKMIREIKTNLAFPLNKPGLAEYLEKVSDEIIELNQMIIPDDEQRYYIFPEILSKLHHDLLKRKPELSSIFQFFKRMLRETIIEIDRLIDKLSGKDMQSKNVKSYSSPFQFEGEKIALIELCIAWYYDDVIKHKNKDLDKTKLVSEIGSLFNVKMPDNPYDSLGKGGARTITDNHLTRWGNIIEKYYKSELPRRK